MNRRHAISTSAASFAALSIGARTTSALGNTLESAMRFGLVTYQWGKDMDLPTLISTCEKSGVAGLELRTQHKHHVEPSLTASERTEVRKRFADSPVELVGYGSNCEFHSADPLKVRENIELAKAYVRLMHDCGGTGVKVKPNGFSKELSREATIEQIGKALNEVAEYAQGYGQRIRVEVHGAGTQELPAMRDIFRVADHNNVFVCWNCNDQDLNGDGLEANFKMVKGRFGDTVHVRELNIGEYPYAQLMKLFLGMDYSGWILLEARTEPADKVAALIEQRKVFQQMTQG
ncbi:MAG: TIM barrel protein [Planctomycetales bacterium]|nr:TIM barrel protein [Planctomycetales bacterium]